MNLTRNEYLVKSLNSTAIFKKEYLICLFTSFNKLKPLQFGNYNYRLMRNELGQYGYWLNDTINVFTDVTDHTKPLFKVQESITLKAGDLVNLKTTVNTTVGTALLNAAVLCVPFGTKIDYISDPKTVPATIEDIIIGRFADDIVSDPETMKRLCDEAMDKDNPQVHYSLPGEDPSKIYVREYLTCTKMMGQLTTLESFIVPGLTLKALTAHPDRDKVRKELEKQFEGKPIGAAEAAIIDKRMRELDDEHLKDDPARHLFTEKKALNARKRLLYSYGYVEAFTSEQKGTFVVKSLSEGIDYDKLPELINSSYSGSISRGLETQYTGANKKDSDRIFQNASVAMDDCGTSLGIKTKIRKGEFSTIVGMYYFNSAGKSVLINAEDYNSLEGKEITIRSPIYCNSPRLTKCAKCVGVRISMNPKGINIAASDIDSAFMVAKLKKMHSNSSNSTQYDYTTAIE